MQSSGFGCVAHQRTRSAGEDRIEKGLDHMIWNSIDKKKVSLSFSHVQVFKVFTSYAEGTTLKVVMLAGQKSFAAEQASLSEHR